MWRPATAGVASPEPCCGKASIKRQGTIVRHERLLVTALLAKDIAAAEMRFQPIGAQRERAVISRQGLIAAAEGAQRIAPIDMRVAEIWGERNGAIAACECVGRAQEPMQNKAAVIMGLGDRWLERNDLVVGVKRSAQIARVSAAIRQHQQSFDLAWIGGNGLGRKAGSIGALALLQQGKRQIGQNGRIGRRKSQRLTQPHLRSLKVGGIEKFQGLEEQRPCLVDVAHALRLFRTDWTGES